MTKENSEVAGRPLITLSLRSVVAHNVLAVINVVTDGFIDIPFAIVSALMFFAGTAIAALGLWNGIQRSRDEEVTLGGLTAVDTRSVPKAARRSLWFAIVLHTVLTIVFAALRPFTAQAFGLLAPMFALGLAMLWASRHANFSPRTDRRR